MQNNSSKERLFELFWILIGFCFTDFEKELNADVKLRQLSSSIEISVFVAAFARELFNIAIEISRLIKKRIKL